MGLPAEDGARPGRRRRKAAARQATVDVEAIRRAARMLEGTHDFAAFQASGGDQKSTVRTLYRCAIEPRRDVEGGDAVDLVLEGDGFLYKMVRIVAGTLAMIGMGLAPAEIIPAALAPCPPSPPSGPPLGIYFSLLKLDAPEPPSPALISR